MPKNASALIVLLLAPMLIAACAAQGGTPQPSPSAVPFLPASTSSPSRTPSPSLAPATPLPSGTPTPSALPSPSSSPTLSLTATITPTSILAGLTIQLVEYRYALLSLTFIVPGIQQPYRLEVSGMPFTCEIRTANPDRLFCSGPYFPAGQSVKLVFYNPDSSDATVLFQMAYVVRPIRTATVDPYTLTSADCPVRGINASCETENRISDNGKCVVSTCVDKCGFWYSVDTCYYKTPYYAGSSQTKDARKTEGAAQTLTAKP